jgi:hypothetical protein
MVNYRKAFLTAFTFLITLDSIAQTANVSAPKEEDGFMRSEGKFT